MKFLITSILACVLLSACDSKPKNASAKWDHANVDVVWIPAGKVNAKCQELKVIDAPVAAGCAAVSRNSCTIYLPQPTSFNDKTGLQLLGHEVWHCFGATH